MQKLLQVAGMVVFLGRSSVFFDDGIIEIDLIQGNYGAAMEMNRQALQVTREDWATEGELVDFLHREIHRLEELL